MTATDNNGNPAVCNWYTYPDRVQLASGVSSYTVTVPTDASYGIYTILAELAADTSVFGVKSYRVYPSQYNVSPASASITTGETLSFTALDGNGTAVRSWWQVNGELDEDATTFSYTFDTAGTYQITAECYHNPSVTSTATVTVTDDIGDGGGDTGGGETDPDTPTDCNCVTPEELSASQTAQTNTIIAKVESESSIIQAAITSLENTLSNSGILDYLKQSLTFRDFDFETGELSTTSQTYEGIVPLFGHFAQNVEQYLGQLVEVRGSVNEEEVKEETSGFWDLILSLFKRDADTGKAEADVDNVNEALKFRDLLNAMFPKTGSTDDVITAIGNEENWTFFSDEANSSLNSQVSTFSRRSEPIVDYRSIVYGDYYEKVLGKEWSVD